MSEQSFEMIAKTFQGLEETLAQELTSLGADEIIPRRQGNDVQGEFLPADRYPHPETYQTVCSEKCR